MNLPVLSRSCASLILAVGFCMVGVATAAETNPYLLEKEPKNPRQVNTIRDEAKDGEDVIVTGRIGGRENPWIKDAAAFSIVDTSLKSCDQNPDETCPTPWDYCCEADVAKSTLMIKFTDEAGKLVKQDARELLGVKELQTVVIEGKVKRDKNNNVSLMASKIFVKE
jgi:hypothetical protein